MLPVVSSVMRLRRCGIFCERVRVGNFRLPPRLSLSLSLSPLKCQNGEGVSVISSFCVRAPAMFALLPRRSQSGSTAPFIQATNFPCDGCDPRATIRVLDRRCLYLFRGISLPLFSLIFLYAESLLRHISSILFDFF